MGSTTKKIDVQFQIGLDGRHTMAYGGSSAKVAAELACKLQSQGRRPHLYAVWLDESEGIRTHLVPITTTRDTTARLSSLKKMIQAGDPIDG
jgi:hypothetical protein